MAPSRYGSSSVTIFPSGSRLLTSNIYLLVMEAYLPPGLDVRLHIIKRPKLRRKGDMIIVIEPCVAEHKNTMLVKVALVQWCMHNLG